MLSLIKVLAAVYLPPLPAFAVLDPQPLPYVDLGKYAGVWYQIANVPMWFEGGKCVCARQKLSPLENGTIGVYNSCNKDNPNGELRDISGVATNDDPQSNSRLQPSLQG